MTKANTVDTQKESAASGSTGYTTSEFSATEDVVMDSQNLVNSMDQEPASLKDYYQGNDELKPLSNKLSKLEDKLYQYLFKNLSQEEMSGVDKFILVPIGLPGMGKSTLSRFLSATSQDYFNDMLNQSIKKQKNLPIINSFSKRTVFGSGSSEFKKDSQNSQKPIKIEFLRINFDKILTQDAKDYCLLHPELDHHQAIDIIFGKSHQNYLDQLKYYCESKSENQHQQNYLLKQIIYLDRNNDSGTWSEIQKTIESAYAGQKQKTFKSVLIVPDAHPDFNPSLYNCTNYICPQMIYECIKRIFGRKSHECLSSSNRPKVVEISLRFAKLYDGVNLSQESDLKKYFDDYIKLDFMQFDQRPNLQPETIQTLIEGYNQTPGNFEAPSDEVVLKCLAAVEKQLLIDNEFNKTQIKQY